MLSRNSALPILALGAILVPAALGQKVDTAALNRDPQVQDGFQRLYNLDYDGSLKVFEKVLQQHPASPLAVDYVLNIVVFRELYREDLLDTTLYAHDGFLTGKHIIAEDPAVKDRVDHLERQAVELADHQIQANARDVDSYFARAMAKSLKAAYIGMAERSFVSGLHLALSASSDDERALQIDPSYIDAEMVPGIHSFVIGVLPGPLKMMAGMFGIHGDKARGLRMLQDCAQRGVITSVEARTTTVIFLRHEARYQDAIQIATGLQQQFPKDFLFSLEVANLRKDAGDGPGAIREYRAVLANAARPGFYTQVHAELAWFGLAETLRGQNDKSGALAAYRQAEVQPTSGPDLKHRAQEAIHQLHAEGVQ